MKRSCSNFNYPHTIPKSVDRNLRRGTVDDKDWGTRPPEPPRPFEGKTILDDLARERSAITGQTPLEFLLEVMRDTRNSLYTRMEAAKSAAPYCHARLARVENKLPDGTDTQIVFLGGVLANPAPMIEMKKLDS